VTGPLAPDLVQLVSAFAAELPTRLVRSDDDPAGELLVELTPDRRGRPRQLELAFVPRAGADDPYFLQLLIGLPFELVPTRAAEVAHLLARVNARLPLVGFGMVEAERLLYFRATLPVAPDRSLDARVVFETAIVAYFLVERLAEVVEAVVEGRASAGDVSSQAIDDLLADAVAVA
jgi:hypothetical protein